PHHAGAAAATARVGAGREGSIHSHGRARFGALGAGEGRGGVHALGRRGDRVGAPGGRGRAGTRGITRAPGGGAGGRRRAARAAVLQRRIPARWAVAAQADPRATTALAGQLNIPEPLAAILVQRGLGAPDLAKAFLRPDLERLSDPLAWADMARAVALVAGVVRAGTPILVHGDYDVDGQCATALLTRVLRSVGGRVHAFVPHRLRDGYDFGPAGLAEAQRVGAGLIIT